jgi:alkyldihydroxyacetonephosphate synthase
MVEAARTSAEVRGDFVRAQLVRELGAVVTPEHVSCAEQDLQAASADWSWISKYQEFRGLAVPAADVVVRPGTAAEVARVVQIAHDYDLPVVPRGGGSGTQGGTLALYGGISLDLTRMNRVLDLDRRSLIVTVEAGITGPMLEAQLAEHGLTFAHYPGSYHLGATVGGYLAARGSGVVSTKYGKAEQLVLSVEAVVPPGQLIRTLPVPNHATGPDLLQVLVGSEGTLGVITEAALRVDPIPAAREFLSFEFPDLFSGLEAGRRIMTKRLVPSVLRLYDHADSVKLAGWVDTGFAGNLLIVMCDGDPDMVRLEATAVRDVCEGAGGRSLGPEISAVWWEQKYEPYKPGKLPQPPVLYGTFDTVARFSDLEAIYNAKKTAIEQEFAQYGAAYTAHFSHWFPWGAMVYDRFFVEQPPAEPEEALKLHDALWDRGVQLSLEHGGTVNEHHGIGVKLGRFMRPQYGSAFGLLEGLKAAWDPKGLMNPGKLGFGPPATSRMR